MERLTFRDSKGDVWIKDAAHVDEQGQICMLSERLAQYEDAEEEGRLIRLPCKVGDAIYRHDGLKFDVFWTIAYVQIFPDEIVFVDDSDNAFTADCIGKTVFLTKEEAEKAKGESSC